MVREAGATEVHMRISCPPTISPCYYGVDTPTKEELIGANNSVQEICEFIDADSLGYLSLAGLREAVDDTADSKFCSACYTGNYPTLLRDQPIQIASARAGQRTLFESVKAKDSRT